MERKHTFTFKAKQKVSQKINGLLGVWVGISFSGLLIWNGIVGMPSQIASCNIPYPGNEGIISLLAGDTLCIPSGEVFTGRIESLPKGALIRINKNAIFQPIGLWDAKGSLDNHGLIILEDILNARGMGIDNKGKIEFRHAPGQDADLQILNRLDAELVFLDNVRELSASLELENYGDVHAEGKLQIGKDFRMANMGRFILEESAVINGQISNFGIVQSYEEVLLGKKANVENYCSFIAPNVPSLASRNFTNEGSTLTSAGEKLETGLESYACASRFKASKPVVLQFFSPEAIEDFTRLRWQVEKGSKVSYFELERSFDKLSYEKLERFESSQKEDHIYRYLDSELSHSGRSQVYYRLRLINTQGNENHGPVIEVILDESKALSLRVDEPQEDKLNFSYRNPAQDKLELSLRDGAGQELRKMEVPASREHELSIDLTDIPQGKYQLTLFSDHAAQTEEINIGDQ